MEEATVTIWESSNTPKIIATSLNMGSYCFNRREELVNLGKEVKKQSKLK
jgi:hypothetical protein